MNRASIILTHNRPELLVECVTAIHTQVQVTLVIDNASDPPVDRGTLPASRDHQVAVRYVPDQPPNLAKLWNLGLDVATNLADEDPWFVAILCDDAIVPPGWFDAVTTAMMETGAAAGCSNPWGHDHPPRVKTEPDSDLMGRMPGWAFILNGTKGLRADESMHFWWVDSDLDIAARRAGGMIMVGGYPVPNMRPNDHLVNVPGLSEQAGRDGEAFVAKHGWRPW